LRHVVDRVSAQPALLAVLPVQVFQLLDAALKRRGRAIAVRLFAGPNFAFSVERLELAGPCVLPREIHPPNPRPEATVCAVTRGNIAELAATAFIALLVVFAVDSNNGVQKRTV
jgi:hypothetical protein